ncbi:hypothetical protein GGR50DRAFT_523183 [Xylaria sp. CBS 124048]|nr:hypothetical protein GGR50DRAFT_523183 [Xylaria sp. CBS 124048]
MSPSPAIPMFITVPPLPSNPGTPGEMPGTPTSTTTSLSTLSTTAIKDGHRGHAHLALGGPKGHGHHPSTNSLEAERADRISRLAGLERVSTIRAPNPPPPQDPNNDSPYVTPTSASFPILNLPPPLVPAYFDANGQPTAITKVSTVGTASATGSVSARTTTESGERFESDLTDIDEDGLSTDTNYRAMDVDSTSGAIDPMDEDLTNRSVSGFDDRMSDDGNASLVGFGEGANSTVSGPIYTRKQHLGNGMLGMERSNSGLSQEGLLKVRDMRDITASDTPVSPSAMAEAQDARYVDGIAVDGGGGHVGTADDDVFVDTTTRGPLPVQPGQPQTGALREGVGGPANRELVERMVRERLGRSQGQGQGAAPSNPEGGETNNKLHEDKK